MKKQVLALVIIAPVFFTKDVRPEGHTGPEGSFRQCHLLHYIFEIEEV